MEENSPLILAGLGLLSTTITTPFKNALLIWNLQKYERDISPKFTWKRPPLFGGFKKGIIAGLSAGFTGNLIQCLKFVSSQATQIGLKDVLANIKFSNSYSTGSWIAKRIFAGSVINLTTLVIIYPLELIRVRLVLDTVRNNSLYDCNILLRPIACAKSLFENEGIRGVYSGFFVGACGIVVYRSFYISLSGLLAASKIRSAVAKFVCSVTISIVAGLVAYPLQTIQRHMLLTGDSFTNTIKMFRGEGFLSFWSGCQTVVITAIAGGLLTYGILVVKWIKR
eukprot:TRINITY_DN17826_c0_g1_i1.p1 TRINITY_DN17826_c0_g1~~TRINITY_DN17826_c0_g1_i1.p1  ORF type:complete len:281 (-),score=16.33 TRINITY_DN17826_c0_g1_i1:42-884(-)